VIVVVVGTEGGGKERGGDSSGGQVRHRAVAGGEETCFSLCCSIAAVKGTPCFLGGGVVADGLSIQESGREVGGRCARGRWDHLSAHARGMGSLVLH
jgi:hypothetical protein